MRIGRPLLKLPVRFCGETLAREVRALPAEAWMPHPQQFDGNSSVPLVSPDGAMVHRTYGPMAPTEWLRRSPYILEIMAALNATWGRSRLIGDSLPVPTCPIMSTCIITGAHTCAFTSP